MTVEWDGRKAAANLKKHRIGFEDAATVFLDPLATTYPDPDHSSQEEREITIGCTMKRHVVFVSHCERAGRIRIISARRATRSEQKQYEEGTSIKRNDELRREYDLSRLKGGVRGKYYHRATAGMNLVLIEPDLASLFPDSEAVNRALRVLADAAQVATQRKRRRARMG